MPSSPEGPIIKLERREDRGITGNFYMANNVTCPECDTLSTARVCPHCHSRLPTNIDSTSHNIIAIVGTSNSGKSHYIASLFAQLRQEARNVNVVIMAGAHDTDLLYKQYYYTPVYEMHQTLPPTSVAAQNPIIRRPLIYRLCRTRNKSNSPGKKMVNLVVFDAAGEQFSDADTMALYNRYLFHASGIILLIDPLSLPGVYDKLPAHVQEGSTEKQVGGIDTLLAQINMLYEATGKRRAKRRTKIPVAVTLTKTDGLARIIGDSDPLLAPSRHLDGFNIQEAAWLSDQLRQRLRDWGEQQIVDVIDQIFPRSMFYGVSSLGAPPQNGQIRAPSPVRVCDPLFWLLHELGFIESMKRK